MPVAAQSAAEAALSLSPAARALGRCVELGGRCWCSLCAWWPICTTVSSRCLLACGAPLLAPSAVSGVASADAAVAAAIAVAATEPATAAMAVTSFCNHLSAAIEWPVVHLAWAQVGATPTATPPRTAGPTTAPAPGALPPWPPRATPPAPAPPLPPSPVPLHHHVHYAALFPPSAVALRPREEVEVIDLRSVVGGLRFAFSAPFETQSRRFGLTGHLPVGLREKPVQL